MIEVIQEWIDLFKNISKLVWNLILLTPVAIFLVLIFIFIRLFILLILGIL